MGPKQPPGLKSLLKTIKTEVVQPAMAEFSLTNDPLANEIIPEINAVFPLDDPNTTTEDNYNSEPPRNELDEAYNTVSDSEEFQQWAKENGIDPDVPAEKAIENIDEAADYLTDPGNAKAVQPFLAQGIPFIYATAAISMVLSSDMKDKKMTRREFLLYASLIGLASALAACGPGSGSRESVAAEASPNFKEGEDIMLYDQELKELIGEDWITEVARESVDVGIDTDADRNPISAYLIAATVAHDEASKGRLLNNLKVKVLSGGDPRLGEIIGAGEKRKFLFYNERTRGGFVVYDAESKSWYKFFKQKGNPTEVFGYYEQSMKMWRDNARLWNMFNEAEYAKFNMGVTQLEDGLTYVWHRTPHVGSETLQKLLESGENPVMVKQDILQWYRKSIELMRDGQFAPLHYDCNPGNIARNGGSAVYPLDFDTRPLAVDSPKTAARLQAQRVMEIYNDRIRLNPHLEDFGIRFHEAELNAILQEVFGSDVTIDAKNLRSTRIRPPGWRTQNGSPLGVDFYHDVSTQRGVQVSRIKEAASAALGEADKIPRSLVLDVPQRQGSKQVQMLFNTADTTFEAMRLSPVKRNALKLFEVLKPGIKVAAIAFDLLVLFEIMKEVHSGVTQPHLRVDRTEVTAAATKQIRVGGHISQIKRALEHQSTKLAEDIISQPNGNVAGYDVMCEAIRDIERVTGIDLTYAQLADGTTPNPENDPYHLFRQGVESTVKDVLSTNGLWHPLRITGFSAIPLMPYGEVENNGLVKIHNSGDGTDVITFGMYSKEQADVIPIFTLTAQNNHIIDIEVHTEGDEISLNYGGLTPEYGNYNLQVPETKQAILDNLNGGNFSMILDLQKPNEGG